MNNLQKLINLWYLGLNDICATSWLWRYFNSTAGARFTAAGWFHRCSDNSNCPNCSRWCSFPLNSSPPHPFPIRWCCWCCESTRNVASSRDRSWNVSGRWDTRRPAGCGSAACAVASSTHSSKLWRTPGTSAGLNNSLCTRRCSCWNFSSSAMFRLATIPNRCRSLSQPKFRPLKEES